MSEYLNPEYNPKQREEIYSHGTEDQIVDMWRQDADAQKKWRFRQKVTSVMSSSFKGTVQSGALLIGGFSLQAFADGKIAVGIVGGLSSVVALGSIPLTNRVEKKLHDEFQGIIDIYTDPNMPKETQMRKKK